ncbi:MAG: phosphate acyltransferase PlsX [bacterium]
MRIVIDAMGGDNAPGVEIDGAIEAVKEFKDITVVLVGKKDVIDGILKNKASEELRKRIEVVNADEVVSMSDHPAEAFKQKKNSSLYVSAMLVKEGKADALVSAGNTGAVVVHALLIIGRIPGIARPAILIPMPNSKGFGAMLDAGGNVDCKPLHLVQFAVMGVLYAKHILKIENPSVGMVSVGEEEEKGNELTIGANELFKLSGLNYKGHVEGKDLVKAVTDVVVCDGFVGNVILKFGEGLSEYLFNGIRNGINNGGFLAKIGGLLLKPVFREMKKKFSYDEYGGAPLVGIKKPVIITHGRANVKAIKNAVRVAAEFIKDHINEEIEENIKKLGGNIEN